MSGVTEANATYSSLRDVLSGMEDRLLHGEWAPGERLPSERVLAEEFGVSRPVVREALKALQERGFVDIRPNRGSFVRGYSADSLLHPMNLAARQAKVTARQLSVARRVVECEAAALAAENASKEDRSELLEIHSLFGRATDLIARARVDLSFHELLARASGNPVLHMMFTATRDLTFGLMVRSISDQHVREAGEPLHTTILERVLDRDADGAREAMRVHLALAEDYYGEDLDVPLLDVIQARLGWPITSTVQVPGLSSSTSRRR
jgi:GntR family transcriptional regulator, transcriptional repressor for pyruvate dehydrogenase complex